MTQFDGFIDGYRLIDGTQLNKELANPAWSISMAVSAKAGGTVSNSTKIVETITQVTQASAPNAGVVLPQAATPGRLFLVINESPNTITVFAEGGSTINGLPGNIGETLDVNAASYYVAIAINSWFKLDFLPVGFPKPFVQTQQSIAALRLWSASVASSPAIMALVYNNAPGDGGGLFWLDATDNTTPDNGTTVIVDAVGNRWKRELTQATYIQSLPAAPITATNVQTAINQIGAQLATLPIRVVNTMADLRNVAVSTTSPVQILGYYAGNDGGEGVFVGVSGAAPGTYFDNGGTVIIPSVGVTDGSAAWVREHYDPVRDQWVGDRQVNAKWFGAKGDGVADDTVALQNALDFTIYFVNGELYIPAGKYIISSTLQAGYGVFRNGMPYCSAHIRGAGTTYAGEYQFSGTTIISTNIYSPLINFQANLDGSMKDITLLGPNYAYAKNNNLGVGGLPPFVPSVDDLVLTNWFDPAILAANPNMNNRYTPLAGITTDTYKPPAPTPSYPAVTYPAFLGPQTQYNKVGGSQRIVFDNIFVGGFVVAIVTYPSGGDGNGDFFTLSNSHIKWNAYGVCINHTQARNFSIINCYFDGHYASLANSKYGDQFGVACFEAYASSFNSNVNVFDLNGALGGPTILSGCYGESVYRLGDYTWAGSTLQANMVIDGCQFVLSKQWSAGAPDSLIGGKGQVSITNSQFGLSIGNPHFDVILNNFSGCYIDTGGAYTGWALYRTGDTQKIPIYAVTPLTGMGIVTVNNGAHPWVNGSSFFMPTYDATTGVATSLSFTYPYTEQYVSRSAERLYSKTVVSSGGLDAGVPNPIVAYTSILGAAAYTISMVGLTATITVPALANADEYNIRGYNPGDCIIWQPVSGTSRVFYIRARTGNVVTAELQNGFTPAGVSTITIDNSANLYFHNCRYYMINYYLNGTFTLGSSTISAVGAPYGAFTAGMAADINVDDAIIADPTSLGSYLTQLTASRITNVNTGLQTITLSGGALGSYTGRLPLLVKKAPPNS